MSEHPNLSAMRRTVDAFQTETGRAAVLQPGRSVRNCLMYTVLAAFLLAAPACGDGDSILDSYPFPDGRVFFTHPPIDVAGAMWFIGMGEPNVMPKDHGGFVLAEPYAFPASVPVLAVADGVIIRASNGTRAVPNIPDAPAALWGREYDDHLLVLKVSESVLVNYAHITTFHPTLAAELDDLPKDEAGHNVAIVVQAGDTLGFVGPHGAMDFSVTDFSLDLNFLNSSLYPASQEFAAHIFDYFQDPSLSQILDITFRQLPPRGGKVDYDVEGRIVGNWFLEGTTSFTQWSRQLAIVYDHLWGDRITIADGSPMRDVPGIEGPGRPDVWWVKDNAPLPENIGVGDGITKYPLIYGRDLNATGDFVPDLRPVQGVMLVEMIDAGRIRVEVFKGTTTADAFTSAAKVYVR